MDVIGAVDIWRALVTAALAAAGGGGFVKWQNRSVDRSTVKATDVATLRSIIEEVRNEATGLRDRVEKLEERERHMLTRAAVHEAWDQIALSTLLRHDPSHPHPPPLTPSSIERDPEEYR